LPAPDDPLEPDGVGDRLQGDDQRGGDAVRVGDDAAVARGPQLLESTGTGRGVNVGGRQLRADPPGSGVLLRHQRAGAFNGRVVQGGENEHPTMPSFA